MSIELTANWANIGHDLQEFFEGLRALEGITAALNGGMKEDAAEPLKTEEIEVIFALTSQDAEQLAFTCFPTERDASGKAMSLSKITEWLGSQIQKAEQAGEFTVYRAKFGDHCTIRTVSQRAFVNKFGEEIFNELMDRSRLLFGIRGKLYYVSPIAINTVMLRANISGNAFAGPSLRRAVEIARSFYFDFKSGVTPIVRKNSDDNGVVFALHSAKYPYIPQTILIDCCEQLQDGLGVLSGESWEITHDFSHVWALFKDVGDDFSSAYPDLPEGCTPGLYLATSDTGSSSVIVRGFWMVGKRRIFGPEVKRSHRGSPDLDALVENVRTQVWEKYAELPKRLLELLEVDVMNPMKMIERVFKECALGPVIGSKRKKAKFDEFREMFEPGCRYTAYDIAMLICEIPQSLENEVTKSTLNEVIAACSKAVFCKALLEGDEEEAAASDSALDSLAV